VIILVDVYKVRDSVSFLYRLLKERTPEQSISHKAMPTMEEHRAFVMSRPYRAWYIVENLNHQRVGAVYATKNNELGIAILSDHRRNGYAKWALLEIITLHPPLLAIRGQRPAHYVAHINPQNAASIRLFEGIGAKHIENTYELA
jgi:RimJ/RimL family protein N-acetyltransferase